MEEIIKKQIEIFKQVLEECYKEAKDPEFRSINLHTVYEIYHEVNKDIRVQHMKEERVNTTDKPSSKQISYAKDLGVKNPESYSRTELSKLIEEKKQ